MVQTKSQKPLSKLIIVGERSENTLLFLSFARSQKNLRWSSNRFNRPSKGLVQGVPTSFELQNVAFSLLQTCWDTLYQVVRGNRRENVKCLKTDLLAWHTNSLIQFDIRTRNGSNLRKPPKREDQGMNENEYSLP